MNYWLHRISHHAEVSYPLLERGLLPIGYSDFNEPNFVKDVMDDHRNFDAAFHENWGEAPRTRYNLWKFVAEMKQGDKVVVPSWGEFSVYEIMEDLPIAVGDIPMQELQGLSTWSEEPVSRGDRNFKIQNAEKECDLGFVRRVRKIADKIPRYEYCDAPLTSRMKIRTTTSRITDLRENVDEALSSFLDKKPINLSAELLEQTADIVVASMRKRLNPDKFEQLIKWYFERQGAVVYCPAKNEPDKEGDADIVATFETLRTTYYVQAKHHRDETSAWAIQQISDYKKNIVDRESLNSVDDGMSKIAWVISTCDRFSQEAEDLAKSAGIILINGKEFANMIIRSGVSALDKANL